MVNIMQEQKQILEIVEKWRPKPVNISEEGWKEGVYYFFFARSFPGQSKPHVLEVVNKMFFLNEEPISGAPHSHFKYFESERDAVVEEVCSNIERNLRQFRLFMEGRGRCGQS